MIARISCYGQTSCQGLRTEDVAKPVVSKQLLLITMSKLIPCQPEKKGFIRRGLAFIW